jgi:hypothetical protein
MADEQPPRSRMTTAQILRQLVDWLEKEMPNMLRRPVELLDAVELDPDTLERNKVINEVAIYRQIIVQTLDFLDNDAKATCIRSNGATFRVEFFGASRH